MLTKLKSKSGRRNLEFETQKIPSKLILFTDGLEIWRRLSNHADEIEIKVSKTKSGVWNPNNRRPIVLSTEGLFKYIALSLRLLPFKFLERTVYPDLRCKWNKSCSLAGDKYVYAYTDVGPDRWQKMISRILSYFIQHSFAGSRYVAHSKCRTIETNSMITFTV